MCRPKRSWVALTATFGFVIVGRIVINRAEEFHDIKLFAAPDILRERGVDSFFLCLMFADALGFNDQFVVECKVGCHV